MRDMVSSTPNEVNLSPEETHQLRRSVKKHKRDDTGSRKEMENSDGM